jgi:hypothetical protein
MVICKRSLDKLSLFYRIMYIEYGIQIDTIHQLRQFVYGLNVLFLKIWAGLEFKEDFIFLNDEMLDYLKLELKNKPDLGGTPEETESDDKHEWGDWIHTSKADRETLLNMTNDLWWRELDQEKVSHFDYKDHLDWCKSEEDRQGMINYVEEMIENHFMFEYDFREISHFPVPSPYNSYKKELERQKIIEARDKKLDFLI